MKLWRYGAAALALMAALVGAAAWWLHQPLSLGAPRVEVSIEPGTSPQEVARLWVQAGVQSSPDLLYAWFRASGQARRIQAGSYEVEPGVTPRTLLERMVKGEQTLESVRLIEGWTFRQVREHLAKAPHLKSTIAVLDDAQVAALLGVEGDRVDGWLFPDTYAYSRGVSDMTVLKRAKAAMSRQLDAVWAQRQPDLPLKTPQEMLVLASVVEKETGLPADRGLIAGVFANRLRIGMPLQSDPTVIYGMGAEFDGNLRRADLSADTPWNTYTRRGLPPTPIALTSLAALRAVAMPQSTRALYFVARGDGSSVFSETLADHNRAVNQFQRGGTP
ncbi:endolytic transglycosylase MltG [Ideonella paludis]|uniref:Endolytic murein transglycosylase n=1 Tax=Ideonella paludis TaxID=1233411 RepID=A0ABS5DUA8_9BURK|nr:endolytic transglycosylase MltG [Ideonella paludis]MBQ0934695.1 endolytic transglycosylase MltG [Ideonella paludis]